MGFGLKTTVESARNPPLGARASASHAPDHAGDTENIMIISHSSIWDLFGFGLKSTRYLNIDYLDLQRVEVTPRSKLLATSYSLPATDYQLSIAQLIVRQQL